MSFPYIFKNIPTSSDVTADDTFKSLGALSYTGSLQDRVKKWLADEGFEGSLDDRLSSFRSGAVAAFSPLDLFASSEEGAWYDPSDLSTLWKDTAGTDPVTTAGDTVARMDDKSGNGHNATQATAAARPTYQTAGGLHWLEFDGVDDLLTAPIDMFGVFDYSMSYELAAADTIMFHRRPSTFGGWVNTGESGNASTKLDDAGGSQGVVYYDNVLSTATTRDDQYTLQQASDVIVASYDVTAGVTVYRFLSIGAYTLFSGLRKTYGLIAREGTFTEEERTAASTYLAGKKGISL